MAATGEEGRVVSELRERVKEAEIMVGEVLKQSEDAERRSQEECERRIQQAQERAREDADRRIE